jgi:Zn-dependent protease
VKNYYDEVSNQPGETVAAKSIGNTASISASEIEAELNNPDRGKRSSVQGILLLLLSLGAFAVTGLLNASWTSVATLVFVLFIHESGHWLGMKIFGYQDLQMFFIPFFGAAVSGKSTNVSETRKAIVALLGPAPGIILSIISVIVFIKSSQPVFLQYGITSLFINGFNLLPIYPLDGGRFMETVIFSRHPVVEIGFKLLAVLALAGLAYGLQSIPLGLLAFGTLIATREAYFHGKIVGRLREKLQGQTVSAAEKMPIEYLELILPDLSLGIPPKNVKLKIVANRAEATWRRFSRQAPKLWPSLGLLGTFVGVVLIGVVGAFLFVAASQVSNERTVIAHRNNTEGIAVPVQEKYWQQTKISEIQLNQDGLFDGPTMTWSYKSVQRMDGYWAKGFAQGEWKYYDASGSIDHVVTYEHGRPRKYQIFKDGALVEVNPEDWPKAVKKDIQTSPRRTKLKLETN